MRLAAGDQVVQGREKPASAPGAPSPRPRNLETPVREGLTSFAVFIPVLSMAFGVLDITALEQPLAAFMALIPKIIVAIVLVVIGAVLAGAAKTFIGNALGGLSYGSALGTAAAGLIMFGFIKSALDQVGVATDVTGPVLYALLATVAGTRSSVSAAASSSRCSTAGRAC